MITYEAINPYQVIEGSSLTYEKAIELFSIAGMELPPDFEELVAAVEKWVWDEFPTHYNDRVGIAIKAVTYGEPLENREEILANAIKVLGEFGIPPEKVPNLTKSSGFTKLRQMTRGLDPEAYKLIQRLVFEELIPRVLKAIGAQPENVSLFLGATSAPLEPYFDAEWAKAGGLPEASVIPYFDIPKEVLAGNVPERMISIPFLEACNSTGDALARVLSGEFNQAIEAKYPGFLAGNEPILVVIGALDDADRDADKGVDVNSPQLFSTGAGVIAFWYHPTGRASMHIVKGVHVAEDKPITTHVFREIADGAQHLKIPAPWKKWTQAQQDRAFIAPHVHEPVRPGQPIELSARAGVIFKKYGLQVAGETLTNYLSMINPKTGEHYKISDIKSVVMHHPSGAIFEDIQEILFGEEFAKKFGGSFTLDQVQWIMKKGNIPVAIMPIVFGELLADFEPGDHVMFLTYGAGGNFTCFIAEMGDMRGFQVPQAA